jgi:hypothetical protein
MAVCDRHDFTAFSAASRADSSAPFFAELKLASMKVSDSVLSRKYVHDDLPEDALKSRLG